MSKELKHIAIIMDGNGRWATKRGLKRSLGHKKGAEVLKKICLHAAERGLKYLSVFAFSTENFKRDKEEVDYLMDLFIEMFAKQFKELKKRNVKVIFSGRRERLRDDVLESMDKICNETKDNNELVLNICLNYGGHSEIVDVMKKLGNDLVAGDIKPEDINEELIERKLYNELPPIDLLIRTSGEYRISNFMLWQLAYSEFCFTDTLFPDFTEKEFDLLTDNYFQRDRRFGGVKHEK